MRRGAGGGLFSRGREWEGTSPYGDPCCPEQLKALSLFYSLLVVLATELAHRKRNRREGERWVSTTCCCCCNSNASCCSHTTFAILPAALGAQHSTGSEGPLLKRGLRTISGYQEKKRKKNDLLFTGHENKQECLERSGLTRLYITAGV